MAILDSYGMPMKPAGRAGRTVDMRNFEAGRANRRLRAIPTQTVPINDVIKAWGPSVIARSRYLCVNNGYAAAAKNEYVSALAGTGIVPNPKIDDPVLKMEIMEAWTEWTDEADADGLTDLYGMQSMIAGEMFEAGECFVRIRPRRLEDGLVVPMQLQLIPSEMLPVNRNETLLNGSRIEMGIEFDGIGRRTSYRFLRRHPGSLMPTDLSVDNEVSVPASEVLHLFEPFRVGQIRGVPSTVAGLTTLALLDLYDDAELERKRTAALFAVFVKSDPAEPDPLDVADPEAPDESSYVDHEWALEPGAGINLQPGQSIDVAAPADVGGSYEPFQYRNLLRAAAGFGVPYAQMTGDLRQTSYGSLRGGLVAFRRRIEQTQHKVMAFQFCRPVWRRFMLEGVLAQAFPSLTATEFRARQRFLQRVEWIPPKWEWIDPLKDLEAEKLAVDNGFKSRQDVIKGMGKDPMIVDTEFREDLDRQSGLGIEFEAFKTPPAPTPAAPQPDDPDDPENQPEPIQEDEDV